MEDRIKQCIEMLREGACCSVCVNAFPSVDCPYPCEERTATNNNMDEAANIIESLVVQLESAQPKWISVEERLPENEKTVLAVTKHRFHTHNGIREITTVSAVFHTDGKTFSGDSKYNFDEGDVDLIYDEDNDEYIVPEGWWESTYFTEQFAAVDEEVLYWMPLPNSPKEEE